MIKFKWCSRREFDLWSLKYQSHAAWIIKQPIISCNLVSFWPYLATCWPWSTSVFFSFSSAEDRRLCYPSLACQCILLHNITRIEYRWKHWNIHRGVVDRGFILALISSQNRSFCHSKGHRKRMLRRLSFPSVCSDAFWNQSEAAILVDTTI